MSLSRYRYGSRFLGQLGPSSTVSGPVGQCSKMNKSRSQSSATVSRFFCFFFALLVQSSSCQSRKVSRDKKYRLYVRRK